MEIRKIQLQDQILSYELHIKNNKRCYLRIKDGKLIVSASPYFKIQTIEGLIRKHQDYILQHMQNYHPKVIYENGGYVYLFGVKYQIIVRDMNEKKCTIHGLCIYVYHKNVQETIGKFLKEVLLSYIKDYITNKQTVVSRMPEITIRKMKSRWGSCFTTRNKVCFNLALIHVEERLVNYVILHELCHFLQANHSPLFYAEVAKHMPDYKDRIKELKEVGM